MNVTINGIAAVYISDYSPTSKNWKVQLKDAFRIVQIANVDCFVKRFDSRPTPWDFLVANRGQQHPCLPLIYDAQSSIEGGKTVYYLFLEKFEGEILHDLLRHGGKVSGLLLGTALAAALRVLHTQGYWHADFSAKNIMVASNGQRFVLIDLDSLEPVTTSPSATPNNPGYIPDQELAVYALTYVKTYVKPATTTLAQIQGPVLNLLQLIFLLDKLVYFAVILKPQGSKFGQKGHFSTLPSVVHQHLGPYTDKIAKDILMGIPVADDIILSQGSNFQTKLQAAPKVPIVSNTAPIASAIPTKKAPLVRTRVSSPKSPAASILSFQASKTILKPGESTVISWVTIGTASATLTYFPTVAAIDTLVLSYERLALLSGKSQGFVGLCLSVSNSFETKTVAIELASSTTQPITNRVPPLTRTLPVYTPSQQTKPPAQKSTSWNAFLWIAAIIAVGAIWAASTSTKTPTLSHNQMRGLQIFENSRYDSNFDSCFIYLEGFRLDTTQNFATQLALAYMYDFGKGTAIDDTAAVALYQQCLRSTKPITVSISLYWLGEHYLNGEGCAKDYSKAKKYFKDAATIYSYGPAQNQVDRMKRDSILSVTPKPTVAKIAISEVEVVGLDPTVEFPNENAADMIIKRVVQLKKRTRVDFIYIPTATDAENEGDISTPPPGHPDAMYIEVGVTHFNLIKTVGIANDSMTRAAHPGRKRYFSCFFEKIPSTSTNIDVVEGGERGWIFRGVEFVFKKP